MVQFRELRGEKSEKHHRKAIPQLCAFVPLQLCNSKKQNKPKTNPNKAKFSDPKPHSKPKNKDFRQIQTTLFMQNEPNGMLYIN